MHAVETSGRVALANIGGARMIQATATTALGHLFTPWLLDKSLILAAAVTLAALGAMFVAFLLQAEVTESGAYGIDQTGSAPAPSAPICASANLRSHCDQAPGDAANHYGRAGRSEIRPRRPRLWLSPAPAGVEPTTRPRITRVPSTTR
jgi:hypothetical protein